MEALIDWLSFTVKQYEGKEATPQSVIKDILGLDIGMFQLTTGGYGYRKQYFYNNIKVYFDGREDMGVHVLISGNGVRYLETTSGFQWTDFFYLLINWFHVKITRLDVAVDETEGILDLAYIEEKIRKGHVVSKWRAARPLPDYNLATGCHEGYTIYFGKRQSDILCRFYDKRAEQKEKYESMGKELPEHWIRCELEMHGERALIFAAIYSDPDNTKSLGELFTGVLSNYMRITDGGTDSNRTRWKNCAMWDRFISAVEKLKLTCKLPEKKLEDVYIWLKKSVSPSLYMILKAVNNNVQILLDLVKEGGQRLSKKHRMMLNEFENEAADIPTYTIENVRHDVKEKIYNLEWRKVEQRKGNKKLLKLMDELNKAKPLFIDQMSLFQSLELT